METKKSSIARILTLFIFILSISSINAQKYTVKNGTAFFKAKVSFNSYTGTTDQLSGFIDFESNTIEFSIPTNTIKTGNKKRDKHMYELLNAEENSEVSFKGILLDKFDPNKNEKQSIKIKGDFTLAGVSKSIELTTDLTSEQSGIKFNTSWTLLITDYGLEPPTKMFMTVKDEHEMGVDAFLEK